MNIGIGIKKVRKHLGFTQVELADITGMTQANISLIESGLRSPHKSNIKKICKALDVPEAVILLLTLEADDFTTTRRGLYKQLYPSIEMLLLQLVDPKQFPIDKIT